MTFPAVDRCIDELVSRMHRTATANLLACAGLFASWFCGANQLPVAAGCILAMQASYKRMTALHRLADAFIDVLKRIVIHPAESGDVIGRYQGLPIHSWVTIKNGGERYAFVGSASQIELQPDQIFVFPGLVYRRAAQ